MSGGQLVPYYDRAQIEAGALANRRLELFWLADPVDAFFLQVQGSGRIRLANQTIARVGYAGKNGLPYVPIGRKLAERGDIPADQIEALAALCARVRQPRAAIAEYLAKRQDAGRAEAFGLWGDAADDGLAFQDKARAEW